MMNEKNYFFSLSRLEVCDLLLACTCAACYSNGAEKWQVLHDKLRTQLKILDALNIANENNSI